MASMLVSCASKNETGSETQNTEQQSIGNKVEMPNPLVDCNTLEEAQELAGFDISLPDSMPKNYSESVIRAIKGMMIELIYTSNSDEIRVRKALETKI